MIKTCVFCDEVAEDFEEQVRLSVEAGAHGVEIRGKLFGTNVAGVTDDHVAQMQAILERYGAQVLAIGSPFGKCNHEDRAEVEEHLRMFDRMIELAHAFGTQVIRGFAFWDPSREDRSQRRPIEDKLAAIVPLLEPAKEAAEGAGVVLAFETEGATTIWSCADARKVIDAVGGGPASPAGRPALGVAWDASNGARSGEHPLREGYPHIRGLVRHVHVKPKSQKTIQTVADTDCSYEELLRQLTADGYDGAASVEHWGSPELMLEGVRQTRGLLDRIRHAARGT